MIGGWRLVAVGGWRLATGGWWRLVAVGGGWRRLVVDDWCLMAVGSGWRLAVGGGWRLAVGGGWWFAVGGPLGRSLRAVLNKKKNPIPYGDPCCTDTGEGEGGWPKRRCVWQARGVPEKGSGGAGPRYRLCVLQRRIEALTQDVLLAPAIAPNHFIGRR